MANRLLSLNFDNAKFNNRLAYLINFASVLIIIFCAFHYVLRNWFTVNRIIIEGDIYHVTSVQLNYIAQNRLHGTFFTLDIEGLKAAFQEIPWVRQVSVKRHFPHTIIVTIEEYTAVAKIGDEGMLAENGEIFDGAGEESALPVFYVGSHQAANALARYKQIQNVLARHADSVVQLWMVSTSLTRVVTKNNLRVEICGSDLSQGLSYLDNYWVKLYQLNPDLKTISLCYKHALAINMPRRIESGINNSRNQESKSVIKAKKGQQQ